MSLNLKRDLFDSFFSTRQKKSNTNVDIAVAGPSVLTHNEENNDRVVRCDPEISKTHKNWSMLWTNEQVYEF